MTPIKMHPALTLLCLAIACTVQVATPSIALEDGTVDQRDIYRAADDALSIWYDTFGQANWVPTEFCGDETCVPVHVAREALGRCVVIDKYRRVEIFIHRIDAPNPEVWRRKLMIVYLHEFTHAHLTCDERDHTTSGLMKAEITDYYIDPIFDDALVARVKAMQGWE